MKRSNRQIVVAKRALTVSAIILLGTSAAALQGGGIGSNPGGVGGKKPDLLPKNMLRFPYGVQSFDAAENLKVGDGVTLIPGWNIEGVPGAIATAILETPPHLLPPGATPKRWMRLEDNGAIAGEGVTGPHIKAPDVWTYAWTFRFQLENAPADQDAPVIAVQHKSGGTYQDAWGIRLKSNSAELYLTDLWGSYTGQTLMHLFDYTGPTAVGEWVNVRVVADLSKNTMRAFVNDSEVGMIRGKPADTTNLTRLRFSYHGNGTGNLLSMLLDEVGVAFLNPQCLNDNTYDFSTEDDGETVLVNGQKIDAGFEFGNDFTVTSSGGQGAAIFDGTPGGPNDPGQDNDLLVGSGNMLIIQTDAAANPPIVGDVFPRPNDDEDGGSFTFSFNRPCTPVSIDLIDIDDGGAVTVLMTDFSGNTRTVSAPDEWTGDIADAEPGSGTLDLQTMLNQPGWASVANTNEDAGFDPNAVMSMTVSLSGSGALDNLHLIIPCVQLTMETEDDFTPVFAGTSMVNGQEVRTPEEFNVELFIADSGPSNLGSAIFDSTPGGPNAAGGDKDLLVGLGNILMLQNDQFPTQTNADIFDTPNDDTQGGAIIFTFPSNVHAHQITLIDADEEESVGVTVTLEDSGGDTRVYTVPPGFTGDELNDGAGTGSRTLDLDTLLPQAGFQAFGTATAAEFGTFDADDVVEVRVDLGGAQCIDNFCFCPCSCD